MVKYYEKQDFESKVVEYFEYIIDNNPYIDPDIYMRNEGSKFYQEMEKFLNIQNKNILENTKYKFQYQSNYPDSIKYKELYLRTDQFGFSFNKTIACNSKYPYGNYFHMLINEKMSREELREELKFIACCVNDTRTIGGCFVWPLVKTIKTYKKTGKKKENWSSQFNRSRGIGSYIEDSVDLTLFEIKMFYELYKEYGDNYENIKTEMKNNNFILLNYQDSKEIYEWLKYFCNFKNYVDYFCFQPFVNEKYNVIDITKATVKEDNKYDFTYSNDILNKDTVKDYQKMFSKKRGRIVKLKKEKLEKMLNNVRWLCIKKSTKMEEIIKQNEKK